MEIATSRVTAPLSDASNPTRGTWGGGSAQVSADRPVGRVRRCRAVVLAERVAWSVACLRPGVASARFEHMRGSETVSPCAQRKLVASHMDDISMCLDICGLRRSKNVDLSSCES